MLVCATAATLKVAEPGQRDFGGKREALTSPCGEDAEEQQNSTF